MELYIRVKNGQPFEHPILGNNFRLAFPEVDINNLPFEFVRFKRVEQPNVGVYEVYEGVTYEWEGDIIKDVHHVRQMATEEKIAKQNAVKAAWAESGFPSWMFDEEICLFKPPAPYPDDSKPYRWDEEKTSWIETEMEKF